VSEYEEALKNYPHQVLSVKKRKGSGTYKVNDSYFGQVTLTPELKPLRGFPIEFSQFEFERMLAQIWLIEENQGEIKMEDDSGS
jgi:hypothetical protein